MKTILLVLILTLTTINYLQYISFKDYSNELSKLQHQANENRITAISCRQDLTRLDNEISEAFEFLAMDIMILKTVMGIELRENE